MGMKLIKCVYTFSKFNQNDLESRIYNKTNNLLNTNYYISTYILILLIHGIYYKEIIIFYDHGHIL